MTSVDGPVVVAAGYTVLDPQRWRKALDSQAQDLASRGVLNRWGYQSLANQDYVCAGVVVDTLAQALALLQDGEAARWLADAGVDEFPPFFVGRCVGSVEVGELPVVDRGTASTTFAGAAKHIAVTIHSVSDFGRWLGAIRAAAATATLADAGVRRIWIYRAVDDPTEFLTALELGSAELARAIPRVPMLEALLIDEIRVAYHPGVFVGRRTRAGGEAAKRHCQLD